MTSFQISVSPSRRAAGRFVTRVRRAIQKAFAEEKRKRGLSQSDVARALGVHRSVINRELRGQKDITLGRVAEFAWALGREPFFDLAEPPKRSFTNITTANLATEAEFTASGSQVPKARVSMPELLCE